jgi:acetyl-CoA synthetase
VHLLGLEDIDELVRRGLTRDEAQQFDRRLAEVPNLADPSDRWAYISRACLSTDQAYAVHEYVFDRVYHDWDELRGAPPAWIPPRDIRRRCNLGRLLDEHGFGSEDDFRAWALADRIGFWTCMMRALSIRFDRPPDSVVDPASEPERPSWFPGARLNIGESCLQALPEAIAVREFSADGACRETTYGELTELSGRVAGGLATAGVAAGEAVGVLLPMTTEAVAILLGIIRAGCVAVPVAESFAPPEVELRFQLGGVRLVFTQEAVVRRGTRLGLASKLAGCPVRAVVIPSGDGAGHALRPGDLPWVEFLAPRGNFGSALREPSSRSIVLFSSGTTGDPKAIPWSQITPIKAASDGYLYQDVGPGDVVAWPTSPGWMMGPWLVFATLINRGTIALYDEHPGTEGFCRFVEAAGVTVLGVVPSLVAAWREGDWPSRQDWSRIKLFSSTGEPSRPGDMLYLMSRSGYRPVIEYCGGTELGGAYLTSTLLRPIAPGLFNTVAYGVGMTLRDESGQPANPGEAFLVGPSIGFSDELLNRDHHEAYFGGTPPGESGVPLRRHGDRVAALPGGFYRVLGRADDTMNLGGIKISAVEIERVLDCHPLVRESAAVAVQDPGGGPERLVAYVVLADPAQDLGSLLGELQALLRDRLNPLFKLAEVVAVAALPRTASHKVMRRLLRDESKLPADFAG